MAGRGGKREGAGRKKAVRPVDGNVARKIKARVKAEELWVFLVGKAAQKARDTGNTADLRQALEYLDDRDLGKTRESIDLEANVRIDDARRQHIRDLIARMAGKSKQ